MAVRGIGDMFAFQRLLWLLVGTVIVPTVLLALYGVVAIRNEREATSQRVRAQQETRLHWSAARLFDEIARVDAEVKTAAAPCIETHGARCRLVVEGASNVWFWDADGELPASLEGIGTPDPTGIETQWFTPADAGDPIGVFVETGISAAWRLDLAHLDGLVGGLDRGYPEEGVVRLERQSTGRAASPEELMARWADPVVSVPLERPLGSYALVADLAGAQSSTLATVYVLGLIALTATILIGTTITLSSAAREIRLSRLQTDFVSHLGHELRTPMTSIRMFIETLQSGRIEDPERVQECLDLLGQESDRLSRRIERVLEWGRMEAGRRVYEFEDLHANEVIGDAVSAFETQTLLDRSETELQVKVPEDLPTLRVDRDAVTEALLNLLQIAFKYTAPPRRLQISAEQRSGRVGLSVADNGPGIPAHERKRIFEKFYQADSRLSREVEGSGLGLSIVRAVVQGHGGRVELSSELGGGSTFTLWLPTV